MNKAFSKAKRIANNVIWTEKEIFQVPFYRDGPLVNGDEIGILKIVGRDVFCHGIRVDLKVPILSRHNELDLDLYAPSGIEGVPDALVSGTHLPLKGVRYFGELSYSPNVAMPSGSYWKLRASCAPLQNGQVGEGITVTYYFSYANGPLTNRIASFQLQGEGIGFWNIGGDFVVS